LFLEGFVMLGGLVESLNVVPFGLLQGGAVMFPGLGEFFLMVAFGLGVVPVADAGGYAGEHSLAKPADEDADSQIDDLPAATGAEQVKRAVAAVSAEKVC